MLHLKIVHYFLHVKQNDVFIDETNHVYTAMPMYNLIEYSDNYWGTSGSLCQVKRDEITANNADLSIDNSRPFKYKAALVGRTVDAVNNPNSSVKITKIVVSLKYLSNFWRSLEMPLINCKIYLELNWINNSISASAGDSTKFKIIGAKLHVPIVTLSAKDNVNLTKQLSDGFKISAYWNSYQAIPVKVLNRGTNIYELRSASFQGAKRWFVLVYFVVAGANTDEEADIKDNKNYFLIRGQIKNYNVLIDGRNVCSKPINHLIKQYDEARKLSAGKGDDYTTGCLLDYAYFKDNYRLTAVDSSKEKALDADKKAMQQIVFQGVFGEADGIKIRSYIILEKSKETVLEFYKGTAKVPWIV